MRNLIYPAIVVAIIFAFGILQNCDCKHDAPASAIEVDQSQSLRALQAKEQEADRAVDPWLVKPTIHLIKAQAEEIPGWETSSDDSQAIESVTKQVAETRAKFDATSFSLEQRLDQLERRMTDSESGIDDLENGQADLTKRVEELTALIEKRCPDGTVKTQAVAVAPVGTTSFDLARGEVLLSVDGVAVSPKAFSGGSNGSTVATTSTVTTANYGSYPVAAPKSGGSNGSLQYSTQATNYQTSSYNVSTVPNGPATQVQIAPRRPLQQLRANGPLRSRFAPQASAPQCVGPNCPN